MTRREEDLDHRLVELARKIDSLRAMRESREVDYGPQKAAELFHRIQEAGRLLQEAIDGRQFSDVEIDELESVVRALRFIHGLEFP